MIDGTTLDRWYEEHVASKGCAPRVGLFDTRILFPLGDLPSMVANETGEWIAADRIEEIIAAGWFTPRALAGTNAGDVGFPAYVPGRIGLFLRLERDGYDAAELRALVAYEEHLVRDILTMNSLTYIDDDREQIIRSLEDLIAGDEEHVAHLEGRIGSTHAAQKEARVHLPEVESRLTEGRRDLFYFLNLDSTRLGKEGQHTLGRIAHRVRHTNEVTRLFTLGKARSKIEQNYSPCIHFRSTEGGFGMPFRFAEIMWAASLYDPWVPEGGDYVPLRIPCFQLDGERLVATRALIPSEYERLWKEYDLDEYIQLVAKIQGDAICQHCLGKLPATADSRRRYCDENCRDAARSKRFRVKNPEKVKDWNRRYRSF